MDPARRYPIAPWLKHRYFLGAGGAMIAVFLFARLLLPQQVPQNGQPLFEMPSDAPWAVRMEISQEGLYEVDLQEFGLSTVIPDGLRLTWRSKPLALWTEGEGVDLRIRFYADPQPSRYAVSDVYVLSYLPTGIVETLAGELLPTHEDYAPLRTPESAPASPSGAYLAVYEHEQNLHYVPKIESGDRWVQSRLLAPATESIALALEETVEGEGLLVLEVWGGSYAAIDPDHRLIVRVNGNPIGDFAFDGEGRQILHATVAAGVLQDGENLVEIEAPGAPGVLVDMVALDKVVVYYPRRAVARQDALLLTGAGWELVPLGFSGPVEVFDVTDPENVLSLGDRASFYAERDRRYALTGPQGYRRPFVLAPLKTEPDLRASRSGADFLAIGPQDLLEPLSPLLELRRSEGLSATAVDIRVVYDQFNGGQPEPEAVRSFLRYAAENYEPAPRFVLLVGDGSYDPRGYLAPPEANRVPVFLRNTHFGGETASDVLFTLLDDDELPDLAIGRLPARTPEQVEVWVDKLLRYSQSPGSPGGVLAIADGQGASFASDAEELLRLFPEDTPTALYAPQAGEPAAAEQVRSRWEAGLAMVVYFGHGSLNMWGKDRLFTNQDAYSLQNKRMPLVLNMTCLTGLFTHPLEESLAEAMLFHPDGGAVGVLAPTSLTLPYDQSFISRPFVEALLSDPEIPVGEALLEARRQVPPGYPGIQEVMLTFLLFGDPAMTWK